MALGTMTQTSLTDLLREDHRRLKGVFSEFERANAEERPALIRRALAMIGVHDRIEKKLLYPVAKEVAPDSLDLVLRCQESHHVANIVTMELRIMTNGPRRFAKFGKLAELVRAHMEEEENQLFPVLERSEADLGTLGERMIELRGRLPVKEDESGAVPVVSGVVAAVAVIALGYLAYNAAFGRD